MAGIEVKHRTFIEAPPERLFALLTSGAGWEGWFASTALVEPREGGVMRLEWRDFGPDHYCTSDGGHVVRYEPDRLFAFTWTPGEHETTVTLGFEPRGDGCMLSVHESGHTQEEVGIALQVATGWGEALTLFKFYVEHGLVYGKVPRAPELV